MKFLFTKTKNWKLETGNYFCNSSVQGFILPMTLLVCAIILTIATGISIILTKELYFSKVSRESQLAYYAADDALMCAIIIDDQYVDSSKGYGIFPYNYPITINNPTDYIRSVIKKVNIERGSRNLSSLDELDFKDIKCATSQIFYEPVSHITFSNFTRLNSDPLDNGVTSAYSMHMDLDDGTFRCATVIVNKTSTYRQIIARGFSSCAGGNARPIERAIINTTELQ